MASSRPAVAGALVVAIAGCGAAATTPTATGPLPGRAPLSVRLSSPAFAGGGRIPVRFTCRGADVSPPLRWSRVPSKTKEIALLMIDRSAPGGPFTHWALAGIPPTDRGLPTGRLPSGAVAGRNDFGKVGYGGPCPPAGKVHHYVIELLALAKRVRLSRGFASDALTDQRPIAAGVLPGTFSRR
jgi:Raf kinase inhibitor-like YbhB/YbcL family protein